MFKTLIVDDIEFSRNELKALNIWGERSGFCIAAETGNGREALQLLREQAIDMVITDIRMPIIDGISLTKIILDSKLCRCVILMSHFSDFEDARKGIQYGAFEYLLKPIEKEELLSVLQRASKFIEQRNEELKKLTYVEQLLKNQDQRCYPYEQFKLLIGSIKNGGSDSKSIASTTVDIIWSEAGSDLLKSKLIINAMYRDFVRDIYKIYPWIKKLIKPDFPSDISFSDQNNIEGVRMSLLGHIERIDAAIAKFELGGTDDTIVKSVCRYILENIESRISISNLAKRLFISSSYLSGLFKKKTGVNLNEYINYVKLERAKILLEEGCYKNYEIADKIGFNFEYFSKLFKKSFSMSPSDYKKTMEQL